MDVVVWPRGELLRCLREDVATDSLAEAWVTIYWGLHEHLLGAAAVHAHGLGGAVGSEEPKFESLAKCSPLLDLGSLVPWCTPTSNWRAVVTHGPPQTT